MHTLGIRKYNPAEGMPPQGDVAIAPVPAGIAISRADEIKPSKGRLILALGEATGHHHGIDMVGRVPGRVAPVMFRPDETGHATIKGPVTNDPELQKLVSAPAITAHLYRDQAAADVMVARGILLRSDLCIGFLVIEGDGAAVVSHQEHDGIALPAGNGETVQPNLKAWPGGYAFQSGCYYIGRQVESAGVEERAVVD